MTTNLERTHAELNASIERQQAERRRDPMQKAMAEAGARTPEEQARIAEAEQAVKDTEAVAQAAGLALARAERGAEPPYDRREPFSFFRKSREHYQAVAKLTAGDLKIDYEEARSAAAAAIKRRNHVIAEVNAEQRRRRQTAKLEHAPKLPPVQSRAGFPKVGA